MNQIRSHSVPSMPATAIRLIPCLVLAAALAACSSVKTYIDRGKVEGRTFSFLNTGAQQSPGAEDRKEAHEMIQQALIKNLAGKGISYVPTGGEVTVAYLVVVGNNVSTTSLNSYFGYSDDSEALLQKVHSEQTNSGERSYFESGTLVVDILDPKTSKLLQRRSIQAEVLRNLPAEKRSARVQAIVDQALKDVPVSAGSH